MWLIGGGVYKRGAATWPALPGKEGSACQGKQGGLLERRGPWAGSGRRRWMSGNHGRSVLGGGEGVDEAFEM